jgi:hypothetical protein
MEKNKLKGTIGYEKLFPLLTELDYGKVLRLIGKNFRTKDSFGLVFKYIADRKFNQLLIVDLCTSINKFNSYE